MLDEVEKILMKIRKNKNTRKFTTATVGGNIINGEILLSRDQHHGSLLITEVNNHPTQQVIRGFPKIQYYDEHRDYGATEHILGYEKLDGTCIGVYPLRDHKGNILEFLYKTRQQAIADQLFLDLLDKCDLRMLDYLQESWDEFGIDIFFVELYGMANQHTIRHMDTNISIRLIGASSKGVMIPSTDLKYLSRVLAIPLPSLMVTTQLLDDGYMVTFPHDLFKDVRNEMGIILRCKSLGECISKTKEYLDKCNLLYKEEKGILRYEGVVLQIQREDDSCIYNEYIKIKPDSFLEATGQNALTVPINEIRKEINKFLRENHSQILSDYDEGETIQLIKEALLEDYPESDVENQRVQRVLRKELHKYIEVFFDSNINGIVDELLAHFSDDGSVSLTDMMRYFGENYGYLKHRSGDVYYVLSKRVNKLFDLK